MKKTKKCGLWYGIVVFGLFGQIAWIIENMYLNVFLYKTITYDLTATSIMVAASAVVATITTLFIGVLSDKLGKRKLFMCIGYIIWGFTVMSFSLVTVQNAQTLFPAGNAVTIATALIVLMDCFMTFFGSSANDAAFNAWVTDNTTNKNRGRAEGVLQIMPLLALLVVFGALDGLTQAGNWTLFYIIVGALTTLAGISGLFFVHDSPQLKPKKGTYFKDIFYGFRPSTVKKYGTLYLIFVAMCVVGIGNNAFMPYLMIYIEYFLGFKDYVFLLGGIILGASVVSVIFGAIADKVDKRILFLPAFALYLAGGLGMSFARTMAGVGIAGFALMAGNLSIFVLLASLARIHTPKNAVGLFQGIRMVFAVLVPMCVGPFIGAFVSKTSNNVYIDPVTQVAQPVPSNYIFLAAIVVTALAIVPVLVLTLYKRGTLLSCKVLPAEDILPAAECTCAESVLLEGTACATGILAEDDPHGATEAQEQSETEVQEQSSTEPSKGEAEPTKGEAEPTKGEETSDLNGGVQNRGEAETSGKKEDISVKKTSAKKISTKNKK